MSPSARPPARPPRYSKGWRGAAEGSARLSRKGRRAEVSRQFRRRLPLGPGGLAHTSGHIICAHIICPHGGPADQLWARTETVGRSAGRAVEEILFRRRRDCAKSRVIVAQRSGAARRARRSSQEGRSFECCARRQPASQRRPRRAGSLFNKCLPLSLSACAPDRPAALSAKVAE